MKIRLKWQRGEADIVAVAVGMVILSIVVAGTSSAMIYGRDVLHRQENQKAVSYLLRGYMEEWQAKIQIEAQHQQPNNLSRTFTRTSRDLTTTVAGGATPPLVVTLVRDPVRQVDLIETGPGIDFYKLTCHARWREDDMAGGRSDNNSQHKELSFATYVVVKS
jgi:hypothetical protein